MDSCAVSVGGRIYVPIRFVAEALEAFIDYSEVYNTVGVYSETLFADEIAELHEYAYTQPDYAIGYDAARANYSAADLAVLFGTDRGSFDNFANAREHLYADKLKSGSYDFPALELTSVDIDSETFYDLVIKEAIAEISCDSNNLTVEFYSDASCIYQADNMNSLSVAVRGLAAATLHVQPTELTGDEAALLYSLGYGNLMQDTELFVPVDVHMNTQPGVPVSVHTITPLSVAYYFEEG